MKKPKNEALKSLVLRDIAHIWHPCTQMKMHENYPPFEIERANGSYLYLPNGQRVIDGISSWWCKSLGHSHPSIGKAVKKQMRKYEHVIAAGTTQKTLVKLSEKLCSLSPSLTRVFYSDGGSSAVEIAVKMALRYYSLSGKPEKKLLAAFENGYHGETALALSLGDCGLYSAHYSSLLTDTIKISPLPYLNRVSAIEWEKMPDDKWNEIETKINPSAAKLAAIVFEPILQGAGGMKIYSMDFLRRLRKWADKNDVLLIADEIMTGFHRTGPVFACNHAGIVPDLVCLSKGLTAGWGAMSAVLTGDKIYSAFYDDSIEKAFLHSSTYAGNALCASAALEALNLYEKEGIEEKVKNTGPLLLSLMDEISADSGALANVRGIGCVVAADIVNPQTGNSFPPERQTGFMFYQRAFRNGAFLRNLGDTIYFIPPLNTAKKTLLKLAKIAKKTLLEAV
jgi:adenosylmethionine-8-amino-7-oxononanoate aminotransferase